MSPKSPDRFVWDAGVTLEALGAAHVVLWHWEPERDRLRFVGATRALGLSALAPEATQAIVLALSAPQTRAEMEDALRPKPPGSEVAFRARLGEADACLWRGVWLEDGVRASGVIVPEARYAAVEKDGLTGLLERRSFIERARERLSEPGAYTLVVADLDRLRRLNEALGHERADLVLSALGSRLAAAFPPGSLLARVGEDEFAVLVSEDVNDPAAVLRRALEIPLRIAGFDIHPTLSIGAVPAHGGRDAPEAAELLRRAEIAVESAKSGGRGGAAAYVGKLESDGLSRLAMEADLKGAIGRGEIVPFYQPIVRLSSGAIAGFEALARWRHPRRGVIPPDEFLPLCAEMGLLTDLGAHMMSEAASQLAEWRRAHRAAGEISVSVNLSVGEIDRPDLVADLSAVLARTGLPPRALKLELTESDIMRDPDKAAVVLEALRTAGAGLALDDFGTGFSSLSYLTRLPFDTLKIDRYFVRTMGGNAGSAKIVRSIVNLGRDLSLEVVAEGVENAEMANALLALGCDYGQGYGYAPALSAQEAEVYLNESYADGAAPLKSRGG